MSTFVLERQQLLNCSIKEAWDFFSTPENLDLLTPDNMGFRIITKRPIPKMYLGQKIEYRVSPVLKIPLYWRTAITSVVENKMFVDSQEKGPYNKWVHTHTFQSHEDGVMMYDKVEYKLPMGLIGAIANTIYVKNRLGQIFDYRYNKIEQLFNLKAPAYG